MIYFSSKYVVVNWLQDIQCVYLQWNGFVIGSEYRAALNKAVELLEQKEAQNWIGDISNLGVVSETDQKWTNEDWTPRLLKTKLKNMALILPESFVARISVNNIISEFKSLNVKYFSDFEDAANWLKKI